MLHRRKSNSSKRALAIATLHKTIWGVPSHSKVFEITAWPSKSVEPIKRIVLLLILELSNVFRAGRI